MFTGMLWGLVPTAATALLVLCLLVSAIGFKRLVYFISIGYGFSIAAMAAYGLASCAGTASVLTWVQVLLLAAYGLRLGIYLVVRESSASYRASQKEDKERGGVAGLGVKIAIWVTVALLYVLQFAPALARLSAEARGLSDPLPGLGLAGVLVMAAGLAIEALADAQKAAAKKKAPKRFCDAGLYRFSRCPNYFGEVLVWTGNLLAGASLLGNGALWAMALLGYLSIFAIMLGSARRQELKQAERYGSDPEFQAYVRRVPIIFPFVPLYSLKKARFLPT